MPLSASSQAAGVGASVTNTQFAAAAEVLARKNLVIGTYDPAITTIADDVAALVTSPEDAGATYGWGFMLHRLVAASMEGSGGGETWVIPQAEAAGAQASGTITFSGAPTANGTVYLYIAGVLVQVAVTSGDSLTAIALATVAAITAIKELPVTATAAVGVVTVTSKSEGLYGNFISMTFDWGFGEVAKEPPGLSAAVVDMSGGTLVPTLRDALDGLGTGDDANEDHFTDVIHGYMQDATSLDAMSNYNGAGNTDVGLYSKTVARPFRSLVGDTVAGSGGLSALVTLADGRKTDRTNGVLAAPGSPNHPAEVAALALGLLSKLNNNRAEEHALGQILPGVITGAVADRWTKDYDDRDTAVQGGIATTKASGGALLVQNLVSFYRPDNVPATSNGYKSMRNISIIQNMLYNVKLNFEQDKWLGVSLVADVAKVTNIVDRQKAKDDEAVKDDLILLAKSFEGKAWVFEIDTFTLPNIQVQIRAGTNGFDTILPVILSGEVGIIDTNIQFDTSITVLL